MPVYMFKLVAF